MTTTTRTYKILLVGNPQVGKTSLINYIMEGHVPVKYVPTLGTEVHPVYYHNRVFSIWDTAGRNQFGALRDRHYKNTHAMIIMYDNTMLKTRKDWIQLIRTSCPNLPVIKCVNVRGNETDITKYNQPQNGLFYVNLSKGAGVGHLMNYLCEMDEVMYSPSSSPSSLSIESTPSPLPMEIDLAMSPTLLPMEM